MESNADKSMGDEGMDVDDVESSRMSTASTMSEESNSAVLTRSTRLQTKMSLRKDVKNLQLETQSLFLQDFNPGTSGRERRKLEKKNADAVKNVKEKEREETAVRKARKNPSLYDDRGLLFHNNMDLCDCLEDDCPGCHFACVKCGSFKCGAECRRNRRWQYEYVELEGAVAVKRENKHLVNPMAKLAAAAAAVPAK